MSMQNRKVLITGGAGFIGSHLAERLVQRGDEVFVLDDLSTGDRANVAHLEVGPRFHFVEGSIFAGERLLELVGTCDQVVHLAAAVGVQYILDHPLSSISTNIEGTQRVLETCNRFRKKVMIASTSEVYGNQNHAPLVETDGSVYGSSGKARWSYAASKLMDEFLALAYHRTHGLEVVIVRFFNTVGPRQTGRYGMVVPRFVRQALAGEPVTVYGTGHQSRTFTHVGDTVRAVEALLDTPRAVGEVVNVGGVEEVTIQHLAERILAKTGSCSAIRHIPYEEAFATGFEDMERRVPGLDKLEGLVGFRPETGLEAILDDVIAYELNATRVVGQA